MIDHEAHNYTMSPLTGQLVIGTKELSRYLNIDIYGTMGQEKHFVRLTGTKFCPVNERPVNECPDNGDRVYFEK
jgi:hypothetical protein